MSNIKIKKIVYVKDAKLFELDIDDVILNLPIGSDSQFGKIKLSDAIDSVSSALDGVASTPKAVKTVSDNLTNLTTKVNEVKTTSDLALEATNTNALKIDDINSILEKGKVEFVTVLPEVTEENVLYVMPDDSEGFLEDDVYATKEEIANFVTKDEVPTVFGNGKIEFVDSVPAEEDSNTLYVLPSDEDAIIDDDIFATKTEVGDLTNLTTEAKDNLVNAINEVKTSSSSSNGACVPTGTLLPFMGTTIPEGFLLCNGATVKISDYQDLYNVTGSNFPNLEEEGVGIATIEVPISDSSHSTYSKLVFYSKIPGADGNNIKIALYNCNDNNPRSYAIFSDQRITWASDRGNVWAVMEILYNNEVKESIQIFDTNDAMMSDPFTFSLYPQYIQNALRKSKYLQSKVSLLDTSNSEIEITSEINFSMSLNTTGTEYISSNGSGTPTTFYLPDLNDRFIEGTSDANLVGSSLEAGLPDATGDFALWGARAQYYNGVFAINSQTVSENGTVGGGKGINMALSRGNSIYGNSETVQPASIYSLIIIKT